MIYAYLVGVDGHVLARVDGYELLANVALCEESKSRKKHR